MRVVFHVYRCLFLSTPARARGCARFRLNAVLFVPLAFLLFIRLPYLLPGSSFIPAHDTMQHGISFLHVYREYFLHGELALWSPCRLYGSSAVSELLMTLTPAGYLAMVIGKLLGVENALALYSASMLLDEFILLLGAYGLARRLCAHGLPVLFVLLAVAGLNFWGGQVFWNFRIFCMVPFMLLFIVRFFDTGRFVYAFLTALAILAGLVGNLTYYLPLYLLMASSASIALLIGRRFKVRVRWRSVLSPDSVACLGLAVVLGCCVRDLAVHALDHMIVFAAGRNADGSVTPSSFLTYAVSAGNVRYLLSFFTCKPPNFDYLPYVGSPVAFLAVCSLFDRRRLTLVAPLIVAIGVLLLFSTPSAKVAGLLYHAFPLMKYFRHIEYVRALVKLLLIFLAGCGLDWALYRAARRWVPAVLGAGIAVLCYWLHDYVPFGIAPADTSPAFDAAFCLQLCRYLGLACGVLTAAVLCIPRAASASLRGNVAAALLAANVAGYQWLLWRMYPIHVQDLRCDTRQAPAGNRSVKAAFDVRRESFITRRMPPDEADARLTEEYPLLLGAHGAKYPRLYAAAWIDPGWHELRIDCLPSGFVDLVSARRGAPLTLETQTLAPVLPDLLAKDAMLARVLGIGAPKMRIVGAVLPADGRGDAMAKIAASHALDVLPVVEGANESDGKHSGSGDAGRFRIRRFTANRCEVEADVALTNGAWLIYADAFHPGWQAVVNGVPRRIHVANRAFKAVRLDPGINVVSLTFVGTGRNAWCARLLFVLGFGGAALLLGLIGWLCFRPDRPCAERDR
ncbi:MAG: hypothetical protein JXR37_31650 [Kiritimatiellae bacterium]|nr:hypothetical protein [Kiritimatiellia bacterium]